MEGGIHPQDATAFKECLFLAKKNPFILRLAFSAGIGGLLFGYDTGPLSLSLHTNVCLYIYIYIYLVCGCV